MIAASSGASATVVAAIISGVLIVLAGILTPVWAAMLNRRVGKTNGKSADLVGVEGRVTVAQLSEAALVKLGQLEERLNEHASRDAAASQTTQALVEEIGVRLNQHIQKMDEHVADDLGAFKAINRRLDEALGG